MQKNDLALNNCGVILTEDHKYWLGKKELFGITGILSRQLFPDKYSNVPEHVLKAAAERGTKVHESLQVYDMFGEISSIEAEMYAKLKQKKQFEVLDSEYIVTDYENFATPIDKVIRFPDTPENTVDLADVKNTYTLDKTSLSWQLSICKYLFNIVNPNINVGKFYAIWTKNGVTLHEIDEIPQEEVIELLECEKEGRKYTRKDIVTVDDEKAVAVVRQLSDVLVEIAELEAKRDAFKQQLEEMFEQYGVEKWDNDYFSITRVAGFTRETFDGKRFKEEHPELHKQYVKQTEVKSSIRIKIKN
jgi:hypothetical protein